MVDKILGEHDFYIMTMGCFYQDELRAHDRAIRHLILKNSVWKRIKAWVIIGENGEVAESSKRDNYINLHFRRIKRPTTLHRVFPCEIIIRSRTHEAMQCEECKQNRKEK